MPVLETTLDGWVRLVQSEFDEMPGLILTCPQICRMWGIDKGTCSRVMRQLVAEGILERRPDATYARPNGLAIWRD